VRSDTDAFWVKEADPTPVGRMMVVWKSTSSNARVRGEIEIDRKPTGEATFFGGPFNNFPDCPHCGQKQYHVLF
jgi:hypothetical protein